MVEAVVWKRITDRHVLGRVVAGVHWIFGIDTSIGWCDSTLNRGVWRREVMLRPGVDRILSVAQLFNSLSS